MTDYLKTGKRQYVSGGHLESAAYEDVRISADEVSHRLESLVSVRHDLEGVLEAIAALEFDAKEKQAERERLKQLLADLQADTKSAEAVLAQPEEAFTRLYLRASSKGRVRGIMEGLLVGFITGALSSLLVWYVTK